MYLKAKCRTFFLAPILVLLPMIAQAQFSVLAPPVTYILPQDFGQNVAGPGNGFANCTDAAPYICSSVELSNNDEVILTEAVNFEVTSSDFIPPPTVPFNLGCEDLVVRVTGGGAATFRNNAGFYGDVFADGIITVENNALIDGDATSMTDVVVANNGEVGGICTPVPGINAGNCGTGSQCDSGSPILPLTLMKTPSREVVSPGDLLTYTLDFSNQGPATAEDVVLTDIVPPGTTFDSATGEGSEAGGTVTWTGELSSGETSSVTMVVRVDSNAALGDVITNDALVTAPDAQDAVDSVDVLVAFEPLLDISKVPSRDVVVPGGQLSYTINVENVGSSDATNITLIDELPPETSFVSATGGGVESSPGVVTWTGAAIQVGALASVAVTVQVDASTPDQTVLVNRAVVDSDETAPEQALALVLVDANPRLGLIKSADQQVVEAGDVIGYTLDVENITTIDAENVIVSDTLPSDVVVESISGGGVESGGAITWSLGTLVGGAEASVGFTARTIVPLPNDTRVINRVLADADGIFEPAYSQVETRINSTPVLNLEKTGDKVIVQPGDTITYTITAINTGNAIASDLVLEDTIPENTTYVTSTGPSAVVGSTVVWNIEELTIGIPEVFTLSVEVDSPLPDQTKIFNSATLSGATQSVTAEFQSTVKSEAVLELLKEASSEQVSPGEEITFTLTFENVGNAIAESVIISDPIPDNTTYVEGSASDDGKIVDGVVSWSFPSLFPGTRGDVSFTVLTDTPLSNGTTIDNLASIEADAASGAVAEAAVRIDSAPVLVLEKLADKVVANPGDLITYTLNVANAGDENAVNATLEDTVPDNTSFESATGSYAINGNKVTWSVASLPAGLSGAVELVVRVGSPLDQGTSILNSATLDADNAQPVTSEAQTQIESRPILELTKSPSAQNVQPGDLLTYTLSAENVGNANAANAVMVDLVPDNTTFDSASPGGVELNGEVTWDLGTLLVSDPSQVSMTVRVNTPLENGTVLVNNARLAADGTSEETALVEVVVDSAPSLAITKAGDRNILQPDEELTYTLNVTNKGNAIARDVVVSDLIPRNTTFVSSSPEAQVNGRLVTWALGEVAPGDRPSLLLKVRSVAPLDNGTRIINSAAVVASNGLPDAALALAFIQSSPILELEKAASAINVVPGQDIVYTLTYSNTGNANATGVVLEELIPENTTFSSASDNGSVNGGLVVWQLPDLIAGTSGQVTATFTVDGPPLANGTTINNFATLRANEAPSGSARETVTVNSAPILTLDKTTEQSVVEAGEQITYTLTAGNAGNDNATVAVLEDTIPANTTFVSAPGGMLNGDTVTWTTDAIAPGESGSVTLTVQVNAPLTDGITITNTATLSAANGNSVVDDAKTVVSSSPVLSLDKTTSSANVAPGQDITYTLSFSNTGNAVASGVRLEELVPDFTTFVSADNGGTLQGGLVVWPLPDLAIATSGQVSVTFKADGPPLADGTQIRNFATLNANEAPSVIARKDVTVISAPVLELDKLADRELTTPGSEITYTLSLVNAGNDTAQNIVLEDELPEFTTLTLASPDDFTVDGRTLRWTFDELLPGQNLEVVVVVRVDSPLDSGTELENLAAAAADDAQPVTDSTLTRVVSRPALRLEKTTPTQVVQPGDLVDYTLSFGNDGNANASGGILADQIPVNSTFVSATDGGVFNNGGVVWQVPQLPAYSQATVGLTVRINQDVANGDIVTNVAALQMSGLVPVASQVSVPVRAAPVLAIEKTAAVVEARPGDTVRFEIRYANSGNATANLVRIEDSLPVGTGFVAAPGANFDGKIISWDIGSIAPGEIRDLTLDLEILPTTAPGTVVTNYASIGSADSQPAVSNEVDVLVFDSTGGSPRLAVDLAGTPEQIQPGESISYDVSFGNSGEIAASDTKLVALLPPGTVFEFASDSGQLINVNGAQWVSWDLGTLTGNSSAVVTYRVRYEAPVSDTVGSAGPPASYNTVRPLPALAAIAASNSSPPQAATTINFVIIDDVTNEVIAVPTLTWWQLILTSLLLAAVTILFAGLRLDRA
ncbi:MAG: hypothetical protein V7720_06580 [Halioglobus sp.]